jgi:hypothetical protein
MEIAGSTIPARVRARAVLRRRVEKANCADVLAGDLCSEPVQPAGFVERRGAQRASRFDTRFYCDAERRGTPLAFVAQVLGQVLDAGRNSPVAAARVYARANSSKKKTRVIGVL